MADAFKITSSSLPDTARLVAFRGREVLSRPFHFDVFVQVSHSADFSRTDAVNAKATLELLYEKTEEPITFHGIFSCVSLIRAWKEFALYHFEMVPKLWWLGQNRHSRIFTQMSFPDILKEILEEGGLSSDDFELRLDGSYETEEHIIQYRESDIDFIHRWMELLGIYYFFDHRGDGEKMVVTDTPGTHEPVLSDGTIPFLEGGHEGRAQRFINKISERTRALPAAVHVADYDYSNPAVEMAAVEDVSPAGTGDLVYHNARFFTEAAGKHFAKVRKEQLLAREYQIFGSGSTNLIQAGFTFELEHHPLSHLNHKFMVTEATHYGNPVGEEDLTKVLGFPADDVYRVEFSAIKAEVQYRAPRRTPWPHIHGFENAVVDGEATSDYAQLDDDGRYFVKFLFDESALKDGKASTRLRMIQPHGGSAEGFHFPLRKGTEVLVTFVGGDPDRPLIAGVAPNAQTPSPVTSSNHTTNIIRTGGNNLIELEDQDGGQRITAYSPTKNTMLRMGAPNDDYNSKLITEGLGYIYQEGNFLMHTHGNKLEESYSTVIEGFKGNKTTTITGALTEDYLNTKDETVTGEHKQTYKAQKTTVDGNVTETYNANHETLVHTTRKEKWDSTIDEIFEKKLTTTVNGATTQTYQADYDLIIGGDGTHNVKAAYTLTAADYTLNQGKVFYKGEGFEIKTVIAATSDTRIGARHENVMAAKLELGQLKAAFAHALVLTKHVGAHLEVHGPGNFTEGAEIWTGGGAEAETEGPEQEAAAVAMESETLNGNM